MTENKRKNCVLITGSNKGLGEELALVFAQHAYDVLIHGRNNNDLQRVQKKIAAMGINCFVFQGDLKLNSTIDDIARFAQDKNVTVLVNNAGLHCPHSPLDKISDEQIDDIVQTNLTVPMKLTKRFYSDFLNKGYGAIININSLSGLKLQELRSIYGASKWGLRGFTNTFRLEAKKHNIRVLSVYPRRMKTRPQFTHGAEPHQVAEKIFDTFENTDIDELTLDEGFLE